MNKLLNLYCQLVGHCHAVTHYQRFEAAMTSYIVHGHTDATVKPLAEIWLRNNPVPKLTSTGCEVCNAQGWCLLHGSN